MTLVLSDIGFVVSFGLFDSWGPVGPCGSSGSFVSFGQLVGWAFAWAMHKRLSFMDNMLDVMLVS